MAWGVISGFHPPSIRDYLFTYAHIWLPPNIPKDYNYSLGWHCRIPSSLTATMLFAVVCEHPRPMNILTHANSLLGDQIWTFEIKSPWGLFGVRILQLYNCLKQIKHHMEYAYKMFYKLGLKPEKICRWCLPLHISASMQFSSLSCHDCPIMAIQYFTGCPVYLFLAVLSWLFYPGNTT
jgi:hypothetical protein